MHYCPVKFHPLCFESILFNHTQYTIMIKCKQYKTNNIKYNIWYLLILRSSIMTRYFFLRKKKFNFAIFFLFMKVHQSCFFCLFMLQKCTIETNKRKGWLGVLIFVCLRDFYMKVQQSCFFACSYYKNVLLKIYWNK